MYRVREWALEKGANASGNWVNVNEFVPCLFKSGNIKYSCL